MYDYFPYTTEEMPEFYLMTEQPSRADVMKLGELTIAVLNSGPQFTQKSPDEKRLIRSRNIWLGDGIVDIGEIHEQRVESGGLVPSGYRVSLNIASIPGDLTVSRDISIRQSYSEQQVINSALLKAFGVDHPVHLSSASLKRPLLEDYSVTDTSGQSYFDFIEEIIYLRGDTVPGAVDIVPNTKSEDLVTAEFKAKTEEIVTDLIKSGEFETLMDGYDCPNPLVTYAGKDTILRLTGLLSELI
jgi:hypothetical protein